MWTERENSVESFNISIGSNKSMSVPFYPQRVSPQTFSGQKCGSNSELDQSSFDDNSVQASSFSTESESESESDENNREMALFEPRQRQTQKQEQPNSAESSCSPDNNKPMPPKDFVCPITSNVFNDPVTLETGQTYERRAILEWLERGNSTCPITRQKLRSTQLPKTNYVLKRLIASWRERDSGGPKSAAAEGPTIAELRQAISSLCTSEILEDSESSVAQIERFWKEANNNDEFRSMLSKPAAINGFVEILFNSVNPKVLKATIFLLSELGSREKAVIQTLTQVDSDVEGIAELFKKGLAEAVVLLYLLRDSVVDFSGFDLVTSLLGLIKSRDLDPVKMCVEPKMAAVVLLARILEDSGERRLANAVISEKAIQGVVDSMGSESAQERRAAVRILVKCIEEDGKCRNIIARGARLGPLLESFVEASDTEQFEIVRFLFELVKLNRRTLNEQILSIIKDEGSLSTMHTLLVYLQTAPEDQCPFVAGLLLQLDLLAEPRKMSIFREEAIESLISCLRNKSFPGAQVAAAETIVSLQGRFNVLGKPLARALLLKRAGLDKSFNSLARIDQREDKDSTNEEEEEEEEEKAAENWERRAASVLVAHEFGLVFEALSEGLRSENSDLSSACFVSATWLVNMLKVLPNTGVRGAARVCLLKHFVSIFKSSREAEDKALSLLVLSSFIQDPEGVSEITSYLKDILRGLRELKKSIPLATEMLKVFFEGQDSSAELWNHKQIVEVDCSENGEVVSLVCFKDKIFSGHSNGTIKVWTGKGSVLHPIIEIREHTKAVTCLAISPAGERLYSASLDRSIRVWSISDEEMVCIQVHDMKDQIQCLVVSNNIYCFVPQGNGVKVNSWNGGSKLMNSNKSVRCLALVQGRLFCGCQDNSIQEIDLATETLNTIQSGSRKLLGKASPIHALEAHRGLLYAASSSIDGSAVKIFSTSDFNMVGTLGSTAEVRAMAISSELIYLGCKKGTVEIWGREKQNKIETLQTGTNCKVLCMALDANEEVLVLGTSDGLIQAWRLS